MRRFVVERTEPELRSASYSWMGGAETGTSRKTINCNVSKTQKLSAQNIWKKKTEAMDFYLLTLIQSCLQYQIKFIIKTFQTP